MPPFHNTILSHLPPDVIARLQLHPVELPLGRELQKIGQAIDSIYFIERGIGSMTACFGNGAQVEVSMFGYESAVGISALMGAKHSLNRTFMQLAGAGHVCSLRVASAEFEKHGIFHRLTLRYVQAQLTLSLQSSACNAIHTHEQRLARWLLICADRAHNDTLHLAQEYLAEMLGSTRSTVSTAAAHFKSKGLIAYSRGTIQLRNKPGLEAESCECYRVVRNHLENFLEFDTAFVT